MPPSLMAPTAMEVELVTVGTELLLGFTLDTNAADIAKAIAAVGVRVVRRSTVGDSQESIQAAVADALDRTGFVIVTGGLGPTSDDVTKTAAAALLDLPLERDAAVLDTLESRFAAFRPGPIPESNRAQADVPRGATVLPNRRGTAPGLWIDSVRGTIVLLPGVPHEMRALLATEVVPRVAALLRGCSGEEPPTVRSRTLRTTGVAESGLADLLADVERTLAPAAVAYLPGLDGVDLRLTVGGLGSSEADAALDHAVTVLRRTLGDRCYGEDDTDLAAVVLERLRALGMSLAVAESCTGGLLGARLTAVPGASDVFVGAIVSYADDAKVSLLGVPKELIASDGAVSEAVAFGMADGASARFGADAAIAITGIAGPSGGSAEKPVGTVWIAARVRDRRRACSSRFPGSRDHVRHRSVQAGLDLMRGLLGL